jgi:release factor glutamine methyltransferase
MSSNNSIKEVRRSFHQQLDHIHEAREVDHFFEWMCDDFFSINKTDILIADRTFSDSELAQVKIVIDKLSNHHPIQHILSNASFLGLSFKVSPDVLIPRPETEELVKIILDDDPKGILLDIGTGSGVIPITVKSKLAQLETHGIDISKEAIQIAVFNAKKNGVEVSFKVIDIFNENFPSMVDSLVSNPPYVLESDKEKMARNVLEYEPEIALFVPDDNPLMYYRRIVEMSQTILKEKGVIYFEIHEAFGNDIERLLLSNNFCEVEILKDMQGKDRFAKAIKKTCFT